MRLLIVLTYYRPHTSGLTIYVERLAHALAQRGHQVTILTSHYDKSLLRLEVQDGVRIVRSPVMMRISKGVIMPRFLPDAWRLMRESDVVNLHLPQFDAAGAAMLGRLAGRPVVVTYHCDLLMPPGFFNQVANQAVHLMNNLTALFANTVVTYTQDYADHSPYLTRYAHKLRIIQPPVVLPPASPEAVAQFVQRYELDRRRPVIGMAARFAAEKGVEVLLNALPALLERYPQAIVLFAGMYQNIVGEQEYARRLMPQIQKYEESKHWIFLGNLSPQEMAAFYPNLDALTIPSLNSTEAFGLVQIEAMINGTPSVASALPGVRQPVLTTGMGRVVPIGDAQALAQALIDIFAEPGKYHSDPAAIAAHYTPASVAQEYERLFAQLKPGLGAARVESNTAKPVEAKRRKGGNG
jgi:glycosyltransferase involved in cell wall biosynthesis